MSLCELSTFGFKDLQMQLKLLNKFNSGDQLVVPKPCAIVPQYAMQTQRSTMGLPQWPPLTALPDVSILTGPCTVFVHSAAMKVL